MQQIFLLLFVKMFDPHNHLVLRLLTSDFVCLRSRSNNSKDVIVFFSHSRNNIEGYKQRA